MNFLKENKTPLFIISGITIIFGLFLIFTFTTIKPGAFLSALNGSAETIPGEKTENWKLAPLSSNFFSFFISGVSLSMFAPNSVKILTHPAVQEKAKQFWPAIEIIIFISNVLLFWFVYKYSSKKEKLFVVFLILSIFITISEIIIARPDHSAIPDFDYRYAGASYYFYSIFIALFLAIFLRTKKEYGVKIVVPIIIVILALQQVFSFHALRLKNEAVERKIAFVNLEKNLLTELDSLSKNSGKLVIPNLSGGHIYETMSGYTLADYLLFFNKKTDIKLVQNVYMPPDFKTNTVETVPSLRAVTSQEFKESLKKDGSIRSYYSSPSWMIYQSEKIEDKTISPEFLNTGKKISIKNEPFDPEKNHIIVFNLYTDNVPGTLYLSFSFKNDFDIDDNAGEIRIDDYTHYVIKNNKRFYTIETDLLQIYTYALSNKVSSLSVSIPADKNALISNIYIK